MEHAELKKYIYTYIHTYIHIYIHTYIHTYVRTYVRKSIDLKIEQTVKTYQITKGNDTGKTQFDKDMEVRYWQHPAETSISSTYEKEDKGSIHIYTDGSKTDEGVGSGIAILESGQYIKSIQRRLNKK